MKIMILLQTSLQLLILYHLLNSCERFGCSVNITQGFFLNFYSCFFSFLCWSFHSVSFSKLK